MARTNSDDMLMEDELAAAFFDDTEPASVVDHSSKTAPGNVEPSDEGNDEWENTDDFPGQLAVDVYETADKLVVNCLLYTSPSPRDM